MNLSVGVFDALMSAWVDHLIDYIKTKVNNGNRSHQDILASVYEGTFKVQCFLMHYLANSLYLIITPPV